MVLNATTDILEVVLAAPITTNQLQCVATWNDALIPASETSPENKITVLTNSTTPISLIVFEDGALQRIPTSISVYNSDTASAIVTIQFNNNGARFVYYKKTLAPGESLQYTKDAGFFLSNGLPTGAATSANQLTEIASLSSIDNKTPSLGQALAAASVPVVLTAAEEATLAAILTIADFDTKTGSLTETAPATDTASSGLNGRLQRIAQRLTSLIALLPPALGGNGGLKVEVLSNVLTPALTANSPTTYNCTATSGQAVASNSNRKGLVICNTGSFNVYFGIGATAVVGSGIPIFANGGVWEMDAYTFTTAAINAITTSSTSNLSIQEFQ